MTQELDLNTLRKVAEQATPGTWEAKHPFGSSWISATSDREYVLIVGKGMHEDDATHIATFDPPTVLALIERLEQAEAQVARVRETIAEYSPDSLKCKCESWNGECCKCTIADFQEAVDGEPNE